MEKSWCSNVGLAPGVKSRELTKNVVCPSSSMSSHRGGRLGRCDGLWERFWPQTEYDVMCTSEYYISVSSALFDYFESVPSGPFLH